MLLDNFLHKLNLNQFTEGLPGSLISFYLNYIQQKTGKTIILLSSDKSKHELILKDFPLFGSSMPSTDISPSAFVEFHIDFKVKYFQSIYNLLINKKSIITADPFTLLKKIPEIDSLKKMFLELKLNQTINLDILLNFLINTGYRKEEIVRSRGEFARRGEIVDIFPINYDFAIRIEIAFDNISSIKFFEPTTQRSLKNLNEIILFPNYLFLNNEKNREKLKSTFREKYEGNINIQLSYKEKINLIENNQLEGFDNYFSYIYSSNRFNSLFKDCIFVSDRNVLDLENDFKLFLSKINEDSKEEINNGYLSISAETDFYPPENILKLVETNHFQTTEQNEELFPLQIKSSKLDSILDKISLFTKNHLVEISANNQYSLRKMEEILFEKGIGYSTTTMERGIVYLSISNFSKGFQIKNNYVFIPYCEIFQIKQKVSARPSHAPFFSDFSDMKNDDFVVHIEYGIAKFKGIKEIETGGEKQEFLHLQFAGDSTVLLPLSKIHLLQKYQNAGGGNIALSNLRSNSFKNTKKRLKKQIQKYAEELLKLYAERKVSKGIAFPPDSPWQKEFASEFPYTETEDQTKAITDIKNDMESPTPMDRLLCGDVGFGKTEVAMRSAFKAVDNGYQVMVLAPTTVLAFQHFENLKKRFKNFPVTIKMLSRFVNPKAQKETVELFNKGKVDILIGTHRIFSGDIIPLKLGLLIIDEEQKFGVLHKEKLKMIKKNIDVLSLSATPIPRTLNMSVMGFKDISIIESPPKNRLAINTCHIVFDPITIKKAINTELQRNGQIYFVNNHINTIDTLAASIKKLTPPNTKIAVAHGKLNEIELEKIMLDFFSKKIDILVSTTIIENGMDVSNANTMFINEAHSFGLSQLYQLRGRIGRSDKPAYAYLITPGKQTLTEEARKRLEALEEFSHLGAGFRIAMLDLEIRGAGDILGAKQSGHINEIGFELYSQMLEKAVKKINNEEIVEEETVLQMGTVGTIPKEYIDNSSIRLSFMRKLNLTDSIDSLIKIKEELEDRFGTVPEKLVNLMEGHRLRISVRKIGVTTVDFSKNNCIIHPCPNNRFNIETIVGNVASDPNIKLSPIGHISFTNTFDIFSEFVTYVIKFVQNSSNL